MTTRTKISHTELSPGGLEVGSPLPPLGIQEIINILPHAYPFLLLDRVTERYHGTSIKGFKNITINEPFFQGHFPGNPIMPGVLQLEALAQICTILMHEMTGTIGKLGVFAGMDNVRFRRMVRPGDRFEMEAEVTKFRPPFAKSHAKGFVDGELVIEADLMVSFIDVEAGR
ncbi:MAG: 3-hydroxyacyl-ACP dehydratase FabZ [Cyanobacteria bacterium]|nr:3-hydroxyacyl-ACP dehydratase FabZ [Cyanobacteriota bacterium]